MANIELAYVLKTLNREIDEAIKLVAKVNLLHQQKKGKLYISKLHYEMIIELAFLRGFLAWETFLEESFILYLMGKKSPSGYVPKRFVIPKNRKHAEEFTSAEARYADWTAIDVVIKRADRYFTSGEPYASALKNRTSRFNDIKTLRNAIAHSSKYTREKFKVLVRRQLTYYPAGLTPGGFLVKGLLTVTTRTFLEDYLDTILQAAKEVVH